MSDIIDAVIKTRKISAEIAAQSLLNVDNASEVEIHRLILSKMSTCDDIFPEGWYAPPPGGASVLFDQAPFERLLYDSLRNPKYAPSDLNNFKKETVGGIYFSPVNKTTNTLADIGFTIYRGENEEIKRHLKKSYDVIHAIAERVQVGTKLSDLCTFAVDLFTSNGLKPSKRFIINSDPNQSLNLGHSVPGSLENELISGSTFDEIKENIKIKRVHFIDNNNFEIPETCAFTVESRLESSTNPSMPSASWHFMVCFDKGKKTIIAGFEEIFKTVEMDYMQTKR